jgi:hypothetical protein
MTYPDDVSHLPGLLDQALHVHMPDYVLVFRDDRPPKEHAFTAISDDAAMDLMRKQYPRLAWALYHVDDRGGRDLFFSYPGRAAREGPSPPSGAGVTA